MSEELIVRHCSPTLAGIKTANLFSCPCPCKKALRDTVRALNSKLTSKGLRIVPLKVDSARALIYVYRPRRLHEDLNAAPSRELLRSHDYPCDAPERCIRALMQRLRESEDFPHEIGLFLGYPPEDVAGFISDPTACKYTGTWKVYGDEESARRRFNQYKKCSCIYQKKWTQGRSINQLTVAM